MEEDQTPNEQEPKPVVPDEQSDDGKQESVSLPPGVSNKLCLNCSTELKDIYCHHCGQKDIPRRQTMGDTFMNFISSNWSFEGKFFQTTKFVLTKPGFLAAEYNAGRRERYFHPARLYVFISFVFFLLFFSLPEEESTGEIQMTPEDYQELRNEMKEYGLDTLMKLENTPDSVLNKMVPAINDSLRKRGANTISIRPDGVNFNLRSVEYSTTERYDSAQQARPAEERDGWLMRFLMKRAITINQKYEGRVGQFASDMRQALADNFSKILFWMLPFFALVLKLLYVRKDYNYSEHLVFSVYYYDFFFLAGSFYLMAAQLDNSWLTTLIGAWMYFYLLFAMKRAYGQGWGKTIFKFGIFSVLFSVLFLIAFAITVFAIVLSL
jgi:hypothetical protein